MASPWAPGVTGTRQELQGSGPGRSTQCDHEIPVAYNTFPALHLESVGANPWQYNNPGILLNSDLLKQILYGPIDGPPRNTAQIGQPG